MIEKKLQKRIDKAYEVSKSKRGKRQKDTILAHASSGLRNYTPLSRIKMRMNKLIIQVLQLDDLIDGMIEDKVKYHHNRVYLLKKSRIIKSNIDFILSNAEYISYPGRLKKIKGGKE